MKKLNLTEVKTIARQIAISIYEKQNNQYEKAIKKPALKKDLIALAKSHPVVALYPTLAGHEQTILLDCVNDQTRFKKSLNGDITFPKIERVEELDYYNIYSRGYDDEMSKKLKDILDKYKVPTELTDLVERYYYSSNKPTIKENSQTFKEIVDKIIIEQIDCKDLQDLIKRVTKFFA